VELVVLKMATYSPSTVTDADASWYRYRPPPTAVALPAVTTCVGEADVLTRHTSTVTVRPVTPCLLAT